MSKDRSDVLSPATAGENKNADLRDTALSLFRDMLNGRYRGYSREYVAREAFAEASAFLAMADQVEIEGLPQPYGHQKAPKVTLQKWEWDGRRNAHVPAVDQRTGQKIMEEVDGDLGAFCPNQSIEHPHNQRHLLACQALGREPGWGKTEPREYVYANN
jgi:hypothetical protein